MNQAEVVVHIVDDEESVRSSLAFLLDSAGFPVRTHATAAEFLAIAQQVTNGCLVTDLRMADIDGIELLRRLRQSSLDIPTIVVTGHGDVQLAVEAMKCGAIDFIEKPFDKSRIIEAIRCAADAAGYKFHLEQARGRVQKAIASLTHREGEVLAGIVAGQPNKLIAFNLGISQRTVEGYRATLMAKMQAKNLAELVRMVSDARSNPAN